MTREGAQKSWQPFPLKQGWPSSLTIHKSVSRLALITRYTTVSVSWSRLNTCPSNDSKAFMRWWHDQQTSNFMGKSWKSSTPTSLRHLYMMRSGWRWLIKDCTSEILETTPSSEFNSSCLRWAQVTGVTPTPEAQRLREFEVELALECHSLGTLQPSVVPKPSKHHSPSLLNKKRSAIW